MARGTHEVQQVWAARDTSAKLIASTRAVALDTTPPWTPRSLFSVPPTHIGFSADAGRTWRWFDATAEVPSSACLAGSIFWSYSTPKRRLIWSDLASGQQ